MESKSKMKKILDAMQDITIGILDKSIEKDLCLGEMELEMVRTTQYLYETINRANHPVIGATSMLDTSGE